MGFWCLHCRRQVGGMVTTPFSAWAAGCLGCVGTVTLLFVLGAAVGAVAARDVPTSVTTLFGWGAILTGIVLGGALFRAQRRRVCPICRMAALTPLDRQP